MKKQLKLKKEVKEFILMFSLIIAMVVGGLFIFNARMNQIENDELTVISESYIK